MKNYNPYKTSLPSNLSNALWTLLLSLVDGFSPSKLTIWECLIDTWPMAVNNMLTLTMMRLIAPVVKWNTLRSTTIVAAHRGWPILHMDVKIAYLNNLLKQQVYMLQPPGFAIKGKEH